VADSGTTFEEFVLGRGSGLLRFAYLMTQERGHAEDLVQEALVKAYRRWDHVLGVDNPEAYVRRIMLHSLADWRRRRSNRERPSTVPDVPVSAGYDQVEDRDALWRVLAELPARQRAVLVLRYYEHLSDADIAVILECAESSVRSHACRAFTALRQHPAIRAERGHLPTQPKEV
jgi:RNA polymerase sigma-70 factor (sigma-E family)